MPKGKPSPVPTPATLDWPKILPPPAPLEFVSLEPGIRIIDHFFSLKSLKAWSTFLPTVPLLPSPPQQRGEAYRTNERYGTQAPAFADQLWTSSGLADLCERALESQYKGRKPVGLNPNIRLYRYLSGMVFNPHYDDDFRDAATGRVSEWTLLIYLSGADEGVLGGETVFYPSPTRKGNGPAVEVSLVAGRALLHRHGNTCMLHEGRRVEKGVKWVLRSDVMFG